MKKINKKNTFSNIDKKRINYKAMLGCLGVLALSHALIPPILDQLYKEPSELVEISRNEEQIFLEDIENIIYNQKNVEDFEKEIETAKGNYLSSGKTMSKPLKNMFLKMEAKFKYAGQKSIEEVQADIYMCWAEAFATIDLKETTEGKNL